MTFRLYGSIPRKMLRLLEEEFDCEIMRIRSSELSESEKEEQLYLAYQEHFEKYDIYLDQIVSGPDWLRQGQIASIVEDSLRFWDQKRLELICYCVMPNHVHAVFRAYEQDESGPETI